MVNLILSALFLAAAPAASEAPRPLTSWLLRCDLPAEPPPSLDPLAVEAALAGTGPVPDGWSVHQMPLALTPGGCWLARRLEPSTRQQAVWVGRVNAAITVRLDGAVIWLRGREADPYWQSDQGFPAFTIPAPLLRPEAGRLLLVREYNPFGGTVLGPLSLLDPAQLAPLHSRQTLMPVTVTGEVSGILRAIGVVALITAALRRRREILYFGVGSLGYAGVFALVSFTWAPFDHQWVNRSFPPMLFSSVPFFVLFFQRIYRIHAGAVFEWVVFGQLALAALMALLLPSQLVLASLIVTLPIYMVWLGYAVYLNVRARREGNPVARVVVWGFLLMAATVTFDVFRTLAFGGNEVTRNGVFQLGILAFVISVLVAIAKQFFTVSAESARMLRQLQDTGLELNTLVVNLQSAATQLSAATAEQVTALTETASTTTEMNQTSAVSASRALELIGKGEAAATVVEDGKSAASTSRTAIEAISGALAAVSGASRELSDKVQRIDKIIDTVSFLADQSAALAINASIEASRAGEAGQGFAAVAREVRSLASDSRRATSEIREVLAEIRHRTVQMEAQVDQGGRTIESGVTQVTRLAEVVVSLGGTIHSAVGLMRQVESSARQHQAGVEQVLQAVTSIQRASESIRDGAETLTSLSRKANDLSSGLAGAAAPRTAS
ncbi:MAG: methyl-accepting chemotaxis protein [Myxococcota bacterium]|nr:methyl-accepting chemotaxis protein [Myxococcota bacterium]